MSPARKIFGCALVEAFAITPGAEMPGDKGALCATQPKAPGSPPLTLAQRADGARWFDGRISHLISINACGFLYVQPKRRALCKGSGTQPAVRDVLLRHVIDCRVEIYRAYKTLRSGLGRLALTPRYSVPPAAALSSCAISHWIRRELAGLEAVDIARQPCIRHERSLLESCAGEGSKASRRQSL